MYKNWIEIDSSAYGKNLDFFKKRLESSIILSLVVKSNAYGHGLEEIVIIAKEKGIFHFSVHSIEEALRVKKKYSKAQILVMGYLAPDEIETAITSGFEIVCFNEDMPKISDQIAKKKGKKVQLHLKAETGTNRHGMNEKQFTAMIPDLKKLKWINIKGLYTHYANIEDTTNHAYAQGQLKRFLGYRELLEKHDIIPEINHTACSAAVLLFPQTHFQMVRLGISQFGFWPSRETYLSYLHKKNTTDELGLKPILTWKTRVAQIKNIPPGDFIGYGCTYKVSRQSKVAVLPVGYYDGYDRHSSNKGYVLINGKRAPIRGRICMNLTMVDITDIPNVCVHDEVVLIGKQGEEDISAELMATWAESIHYEIIARLNTDIPRIII